MGRLFWVACASMLFAGCLGGTSPGDGANASEEGEPVADGQDEDGPERTSSDQIDSQDPKEPLPIVAMTWYPHTVLACNPEDTFCNCGTVDQFMDTENFEGECDAHGKTTAAPIDMGTCPGECWPAADMPAYPAGTQIDATLYITTDAADVCTFVLELFDGDASLGTGAAHDVVFVGLGGATFEEIPLSFTLTGTAPNDPTMVLTNDCSVAYFVGYDGDHATKFEFTP